MCRVIQINPLVERIAEVIDEYNEANGVTNMQVLDALKYVHASMERYVENIPANKLH